MSKLNSNDIAEIGRYFNPNGQIVTSLPNAKSVRDFSEVAIQNKDGNTFDTYKMIKGNWIKTGSNVNNITNIIQGGSGGSGTADVTSFNGRTGVVVPASGDYTPAQVGLGNVTNDAQIKASDFPASSIDGNFAEMNGTSGKSIKDSGISLDIDGTLTADSDTKISSEKSLKTYIDIMLSDFDGSDSLEKYPSTTIYDSGLSNGLYDDVIQIDAGDSLITY